MGEAREGEIVLDVDAAGFGWYVDATPDDNIEFTVDIGDHMLLAAGNSEAAGKIDLLTVVSHEIGHLLGFDHSEGSGGHELMDETLKAGVRLLPEAETDHEHDVVQPVTLARHTERAHLAVNGMERWGIADILGGVPPMIRWDHGGVGDKLAALAEAGHGPLTGDRPMVFDEVLDRFDDVDDDGSTAHAQSPEADQQHVDDDWYVFTDDDDSAATSSARIDWNARSAAPAQHWSRLDD